MRGRVERAARMLGPEDVMASSRELDRRETRVTVAVITHDRREELARALGRLAALPSRPEVIVVDNASSDGTAEFVR